MLGMGFFKSLIKEHGKTYFEPIGKALAGAGRPPAEPDEPRARLGLAQAAGRLRQLARRREARRGPRTRRCPAMPANLAAHARFAIDGAPEEPDGDQRGDAEAPAQAGRPPVPDVRAVVARPGHGRDAHDEPLGRPAGRRGRPRRGRHPLPGPDPQAHRPAADRRATSGPSRSWARPSSRAASRRSRGSRRRRS